MSELTPPQRLGRRMDQLLVDQSLFAWAHRVLGIISGCTCVLSAIATNRLLVHKVPTLSYSQMGGVSAMVFFLAALPFVISYSNNIHLVDEKLTRTVLFAIGLVGTALVVDTWTILIFWSDHSALTLGAVYFCQAVAYIGLGHLTLGRFPVGDIPNS